MDALQTLFRTREVPEYFQNYLTERVIVWGKELGRGPVYLFNHSSANQVKHWFGGSPLPPNPINTFPHTHPSIVSMDTFAAAFSSQT